jgi:hypothetical protein
MILDPDKILTEVELFFRFKSGEDLEHMESVIKRVERYLNAFELIKKFSFQSETARREHKLKYEVHENTVRGDFLIAWQILGKEGIFNKDSVRNWMINKLMKWIEKAEDENDTDAKAKYSKLLYEYRDLDKDTSDLPNLADFKFPEVMIKPNDRAVEIKNDPKLLEQKITAWNKPKKQKSIEEAKIIPNENGN